MAAALCLPRSAPAELVVHNVAKFDCSECTLNPEVRANGHILVSGGSVPGPNVLDVSPEGVVTRVAGCACADTGQGPGDGGQAVNALLYAADTQPTADGGFMVADPLHHRVRQVTSEGVISTVAGTGASGSSGDDGPATSATITGLGLAERTGGGFLINDLSAVRAVDETGEITTVAGTGSFGFSGDGGPALSAEITAREIDGASSGFLLVNDVACRIRQVDAGGDIDTVAGSSPPSSGSAPCDPVGEQFADTGVPGESAVAAGLAWPKDVASTADGGFVLVTQRGQHVLDVDADGHIASLAGNGFQGFGGDGCPADDVALYFPTGVTVAADGTVYFIDQSAQSGGEESKEVDVLRSISEGTVTDCDLIGIQGTPSPDDIDGSEFREKMLAGAGNDDLEGAGGKDNLLGQGGADTVSAGSGNDKIDVAGGGHDDVNCGSGRDVVDASGSDDVARNCEVVK